MKTVKCENCQVSFQKAENQIKRTAHNFCSCSCSVSFNRRGKPSNNSATPRTCLLCKKTFFARKPHRSTKFCPNCMNGKATRIEYHKSLTLAYIRSQTHLKGHHPSWIYAQVRQFNRIWNKSLIAAGCKICGYRLHVELCHLRALSEFPLTATLGEVNHSSNVVPLCRNHHWEFDNGFISL